MAFIFYQTFVSARTNSKSSFKPKKYKSHFLRISLFPNYDFLKNETYLVLHNFSICTHTDILRYFINVFSRNSTKQQTRFQVWELKKQQVKTDGTLLFHLFNYFWMVTKVFPSLLFFFFVALHSVFSYSNSTCGYTPWCITAPETTDIEATEQWTYSSLRCSALIRLMIAVSKVSRSWRICKTEWGQWN